MSWHAAPADVVRAAIARSWLGSRGCDALGHVVLRGHQRAAAARLRAMLRSHGGAMLADPVGLGKTYTALAAARDAKRLLVVAPASLRGMWHDACAATGVNAAFVTYQALSRGRAPAEPPDLVIVDEAHHARNSATRRYRLLARLCASAPVLLVSATPVHNRIDDLRAQLALFLGRRAWVMPVSELARHVVKRDVQDGDGPPVEPSLPRVNDVRWIDIGDDSELLREIVNLPPPVPVEDGGDGGQLVALSLVRQWASSRAALGSALRTRLAQGEALVEAFAGNRHPTRAELRAWCYADGAMQLAFPQLASDHVLTDGALIDDAAHHLHAVRALLQQLAAGPDPDDARAAALLGVMRAHPDSQLIVFAEFAATVRALYARLVAHGAVAMLTSRGGLVSGGRVTRRELLAQFSPEMSHRVHPARRVRTLITTDLLSEGVNLQTANVVVHADLPWSPARCEQRVGRVRRLASPHGEVFVYALRPPAPADTLLRLENRLRDKIAAAAHAIGVRGTIMPRLFPAPVIDAPPSLRLDAELTPMLQTWLGGAAPADADVPLIAAVAAEECGFLAVVDVGDGPTIVAGDADGVDATLARVLALARTANGRDHNVDPVTAAAAFDRLDEWCRDRIALAPIEFPLSGPALARRRLIRRIDAIASRSPRHLRSRYAPMARDARRAATATFGTGAESVLAELAEARMPDDAWLHAVCTFAELHARGAPSAGCAIKALLLLVPNEPDAAAAADPP